MILFPWQLHFLGSLRARRDQETITRFRSQKFGALLAYLALFPRRTHTREALADLLWPDAEVETGRMNLRTALSSLRRQLEPPGTLAGSVLVTDGRIHVSLNPDAFVTDVAQFEAALTAATQADSPLEQATHLAEAVSYYAGPLLPSFYDDWVLAERDRLAEAYLRALIRLIHWHESAGDRDAVLDFARRALVTDPLLDEAHAAVIRLLAASGQVASARRHFDEMVKLFDDQGLTPSPQTRALLGLERQAKSPIGVAPEVAAPTVAAVPTVERTLPLPEPSVAVVLPLTTTRFFGRESEVTALQAVLPDPSTRLVTVTGLGGAGKTRLAVEVARAMTEAFPGGVFFVPLANLTLAAQVPDAIAKMLHLPAETDSDRLTQVTNALSHASLKESGTPTPVLLVLDNLEHLAEEASAFLLPLLERVQTLTILATSRQRLLIEAEHEFPLLPLPTPAYPGTPERLLEFSSVQLFVSRAQTARADFQLNARNAASVAALCGRLEGIPLAIELAAAWSQTLSPAQLLERMQHRFDVLVSRRRDLSPRHRTMRAAIETSCDLLPAPARALWLRLAVFHGGWTLEAAEAVAEMGEETLVLLATLRDHSLVQEDTRRGDDPRFYLLETLRDFAWAEVDEAKRERLGRRHAHYFADLTARAEASRNTAQEAVWVQALEAENANLRRALDWCRTASEAETGLRLVGSLWWFWMQRGYLSEGRQHIANVLAQTDNNALVLLRARALNGAGCLARLQGDLSAARPLLADAAALFTQAGDEAGRAMALQNQGIVAQDGGDYVAALAFYTESLDSRRARNDLDGTAKVLNSLGVLAYEQGDFKGSRARLEECLNLRRRLGQMPSAANLVNLGTIAFQEGDLVGARGWLEQAVATAQKAGQRQMLAGAQSGLGDIATRERNYALAQIYYVEALTVFLELGDSGSFAQTLESAAHLAAVQSRFEDAAHLWGAAEMLRETIALPLPLSEHPSYDTAVGSVRAALGDTVLHRCWSGGRLWTPEQALQTVRAAFAPSLAPSPERTADAALPRI